MISARLSMLIPVIAMALVCETRPLSAQQSPPKTPPPTSAVKWKQSPPRTPPPFVDQAPPRTPPPVDGQVPPKTPPPTSVLTGQGKLKTPTPTPRHKAHRRKTASPTPTAALLPSASPSAFLV
jgi:hypothetical protein